MNELVIYHNDLEKQIFELNRLRTEAINELIEVKSEGHDCLNDFPNKEAFIHVDGKYLKACQNRGNLYFNEIKIQRNG